MSRDLSEGVTGYVQGSNVSDRRESHFRSPEACVKMLECQSAGQDVQRSISEGERNTK